MRKRATVTRKKIRPNRSTASNELVSTSCRVRGPAATSRMAFLPFPPSFPGVVLGGLVTGSGALSEEAGVLRTFTVVSDGVSFAMAVVEVVAGGVLEIVAVGVVVMMAVEVDANVVVVFAVVATAVVVGFAAFVVVSFVAVVLFCEIWVVGVTAALSDLFVRMVVMVVVMLMVAGLLVMAVRFVGVASPVG